MKKSQKKKKNIIHNVFLKKNINLGKIFILLFVYFFSTAFSSEKLDKATLDILKQSFPFYTKTNGYLYLEWSAYKYVEDIEEEEEDRYEILNSIQVYFEKDEDDLYNLFLQLDSANINVKYSLLFLKDKGWYKFKSSKRVKLLTRKKMASLVKNSIGIPTFFLYKEKNLMDDFNFFREDDKSTYQITVSSKDNYNENRTKIYIDKKTYQYRQIEYIKHNVLTKGITFFYNNDNDKLFSYLRQDDILSGKINSKVTIKNANFDNSDGIPKSFFSFEKFSKLYEN